MLKSLDELEKNGWEVMRLAPRADGSVGAGVVLAARRPDTPRITLILVQNETGAVGFIVQLFCNFSVLFGGLRVYCAAIV